jgi:hypothetical protein
MDEFLPSLDDVYSRLGVLLATRGRGKLRGACVARSRDERAAAARLARMTLCMVESVLPRSRGYLGLAGVIGVTSSDRSLA